jgi:hypothetical protein
MASDIEALMCIAKSAVSWHDGIERGFCYPLAPGQVRRGRTHNRRWDAKKVVKAILAGLPFSPTR